MEGATVNYLHTSAQHFLTDIEYGKFPLRLANNKTTIITTRGTLPNLGLAYLDHTLTQGIIAQSHLQDSGCSLSFPGDIMSCHLTYTGTKLELRRRNGGYYIYYTALQNLFHSPTIRNIPQESLDIHTAPNTTSNTIMIDPPAPPTHTTMTYDEFHRSEGHRIRRTTLRMAKQKHITLTHTPSKYVQCEAWMLDRSIFASSMIFLGYTPKMDLFAAKHNVQVPHFVSPEGGGIATDWRQIDFTNEPGLYGNPIWPDIKELIDKNTKAGTTLAIVVPLRPTATWWDSFLAHLQSQPYIIQNTTSIFRRHSATIVGKPSWLFTLVALLGPISSHVTPGDDLKSAIDYVRFNPEFPKNCRVCVEGKMKAKHVSHCDKYASITISQRTPLIRGETLAIY
ncbi:hypothetical protein SARC_09551 [Sphaeroforma arctica JP610]|uniref:Uncharacterized protein n=1 Tax=Sphaeroforma arctica JP610 TaxID=667725 RepID=A0A0L0FML6_9EUKA|nr:hypothetical protein SARC_09551 [Sphaeroforma arctica JP610]KNC77997.1 hypothetical protein SARC_09551 [Sphaeroforma arctica JP610]|eukprot:XP_014151899.1 hypothetical protein SARC_09551 [Sphaeroforma arctica JP610]